MAEWQLLDDSCTNLNRCNKNVSLLERVSLKTLKRCTDQSLPFGYPQTNTVYLSMVAIKHWLKKANVNIYYRGIEKLQKVEGRRNIITPNHPNLFDSIVTRFLFYLNDKFVPFTAAIDSLAKVPILSQVLKDNGTFFINTKRFGDIDYREEVNTFMRAICDNGEWLQFYIEGDRNAQERQRIARRGLLKAMVDENCAFFPVSVSYEKVTSSYTNNIGNVYVEIHDPILFDKGDDFDEFVATLSSTIQSGCNVFTTDLVATLLLHREAGSTVQLETLEAELDWFRAVIVSRDVPYIDVDLLVVFQHLRLKYKDGYVIVPTKKDQLKWLIAHRERILYTFYDICDPSELIRSEFPLQLPYPLIFDEQLMKISERAIDPLVQSYCLILALLEKGVANVREIEEQVVNSGATIDMVRNSMRNLQVRGAMVIEAGIITLI